MSKEIKVALFIIASVLIAVFGSNFLMSKGIFSSSNTYYVVFDNTEGLYKSNLIVINGIQVGKVADMQLIKEGKNVDKILVTLDINDDIKIPTGSKAILGAEGTGLMGDMMVKIKKNNKSTEFLKEGDYLEKGVEIGLMTPPLGLSVYVIKSSLDDTEISLGTIFAGAFPFVIITFVIAVLLMMFPTLSLLLL